MAAGQDPGNGAQSILATRTTHFKPTACEGETGKKAIFGQTR
jgi:hypothetical protein